VVEVVGPVGEARGGVTHRHGSGLESWRDDGQRRALACSVGDLEGELESGGAAGHL
jgi:hypothetical protein